MVIQTPRANCKKDAKTHENTDRKRDNTYNLCKKKTNFWKLKLTNFIFD